MGTVHYCTKRGNTHFHNGMSSLTSSRRQSIFRRNFQLVVECVSNATLLHTMQTRRKESHDDQAPPHFRVCSCPSFALKLLERDSLVRDSRATKHASRTVAVSVKYTMEQSPPPRASINRLKGRGDRSLRVKSRMRRPSGRTAPNSTPGHRPVVPCTR